MTYLVRYRQGEGPPSEHWIETLIEAKQQAVDAVGSGAAKRAEIRDAAGKVVFYYPAEDSDA